MKSFVRNPFVIGGGIALAVIGFLLFRPDTLVTDVRVSAPLEEAFAASPSETTGATVETSATTTNSSAEAEVVEVSRGTFVGIDHRASGTATIYSQNDRYVLRFEDDTDIQNGPDLYVWVLPSDSYEGSIPAEYLDLGTLTGNVGSQNYQLPEGFDPELHRTVLIWCLRFAVPFAAAPLT
ncbi:MAG: DM13 domain-containing protein [Acidimicrobiia bacterium]